MNPKYGERAPAPYECIDTRTNLESCGGCVVPYSLTGSSLDDDDEEEPDMGVDCTALPGVSDVGCHAGRCVVRKCAKGYKLEGSFWGGSKCIKKHRATTHHHNKQVEVGMLNQGDGRLAWTKHD